MDTEGARKPVTGTWLDFYHANDHEGDLWNATVADWTDEQWQAKVGEIAEAGLDTLVVMGVALEGRAFYPSRVLPVRWQPLRAQDPLAAVLEAADRLGLAVFIGMGFFQPGTGVMASDAAEQERRRAVPLEVAERYGSHRSFFGWYLPVEEAIQGYVSDAFRRYADELSEACARAAPRPILVAPYGTRTALPDERFVQQLRDLPVTFVAYQDEVGVHKTDVAELDGIYAALAQAHTKAHKPIWTDLELFDFEGEVYHSPLLPASPERVVAQVRAEAPHVDKLLSYQYLGILNRRHSAVFAGHPASADLYEALARAGTLPVSRGVPRHPGRGGAR